ncbi:uncharacterized protein LOC123545312 [Mercenaria mercenaria]|uniref:uncharacterized protein LOC123545312 n=1 Tax=Mercenaria mercenaria TaxID=6596 RepID=UPI00234E62B2|nr:uncharacterized protein LOC123545312 [Mercenaria mercenaria]
MSSKEDENWSLWIGSTLDTFGFKQEITSFRSHCFDEFSANVSSKSEQIYPIRFSLVGSAGEGFRHGRSDIDLLAVLINTVCLDRPMVNAHLNTLKTDYSGTAPGYTKVILINKKSHDIRHPFHFNTMYRSTEGHPYIPSSALQYIAIDLEINGPALSLESFLQSYIFSDMDFVFSFYFGGKEHLRKWAKRSRFYTWPQPTVLKEISSMEGYIVPVGDKPSDFQSLEWRICYTTAEKKLVGYLNAQEQKLYILLKMVSKTILQPVCKAITSYVVKNVVFWIAEGTAEQQCSVNCLVFLLQKSLYFIKYCLENNHLPNYMIPERNLIRAGVFGKEKQSTIDFLSELLKEGGAIIVRIPKLYQCMSYMVRSPGRAVQYGNWRDDVEKQTMKLIVQLSKNWTPFVPLEHQSSLLTAAFEGNIIAALKYLMLLVPELPNMILQGQFEEIIYLLKARLEATMLL